MRTRCNVAHRHSSSRRHSPAHSVDGASGIPTEWDREQNEWPIFHAATRDKRGLYHHNPSAARSVAGECASVTHFARSAMHSTEALSPSLGRVVVYDAVNDATCRRTSRSSLHHHLLSASPMASCAFFLFSCRCPHHAPLAGGDTRSLPPGRPSASADAIHFSFRHCISPAL